MSFLSNLQAGQFAADGAYYTFGNTAPPAPTGPNTSLVVIVGGATDGTPNVPVPFTGGPSCIQNFGNGTLIQNSLTRTALNMMPEVNQFIGIRVTDGTDLAAVISIQDAANPGVTVLQAISKTTGSNANQGQGRVDLQNGTLTSNPVFRVTLYYPNSQPETFNNIIGYATPGGAYDSSTFQTNASSAINGLVANVLGSANWVAVPGTSSAAPDLGEVFAASGGTDGASGLTTQMLLGTDGTTGRTGMYAARGTGFAFLNIAGMTDVAAFQVMNEFVNSETPGGIGGISFPLGTSTDEANSLRSTNALISPRMLDCIDWDYVYDAASGTYIWAPPLDKVMAVVASLPPYQSPSNKPYNAFGGAIGISATERTATIPVAGGEPGQRQQNGLLYLTNTLQGSGGLWKLPHGQASDGSNISDTRMRLYVANLSVTILSQFVGEMQAPDALDDTSSGGVRYRASAALNGLQTTLNPPKGSNLPRQLAGFKAVCNLTNNTQSSIEQGFLVANIYGQTLTGVKFALAAVYVGNTVQIQDATATG